MPRRRTSPGHSKNYDVTANERQQKYVSINSTFDKFIRTTRPERILYYPEICSESTGYCHGHIARTSTSGQCKEAILFSRLTSITIPHNSYWVFENPTEEVAQEMK